MARVDFTNELQALGYQVQDHGDGKISFPYTVPCGKFADQEIRLGFVVPEDFNLSSPSGPHITPKLLPRKTDGDKHPHDGVHDSPFGDEWQYWSRPMHHWAKTGRTVKEVLAHMRRLFDTQ